MVAIGSGFWGKPGGKSIRTAFPKPLPLSSDAGSNPTCGPAGFTVVCKDGNTCPANGVCGKDGTCTCDSEHLAVDCSGRKCHGDCIYPLWKCEPRKPGPDNFTLECPRGDGGFFQCPNHGACLANASCDCADGYVSVYPDGTPCNGKCAYPNWWCVPRKPGTCGAANFTVQCSSTDYCPWGSFCKSGGGCTCDKGLHAVTCDGQRCSANQPCTYPNWWCR